MFLTRNQQEFLKRINKRFSVLVNAETHPIAVTSRPYNFVDVCVWTRKSKVSGSIISTASTLRTECGVVCERQSTEKHFISAIYSVFTLITKSRLCFGCACHTFSLSDSPLFTFLSIFSSLSLSCCIVLCSFRFHFNAINSILLVREKGDGMKWHDKRKRREKRSETFRRCIIGRRHQFYLLDIRTDTEHIVHTQINLRHNYSHKNNLAVVIEFGWRTHHWRLDNQRRGSFELLCTERPIMYTIQWWTCDRLTRITK